MVRLEKLKDTFFIEHRFKSHSHGMQFIMDYNIEYKCLSPDKLSENIINKINYLKKYRCKYISKKNKQCHKMKDTSNGYCMIHYKYLINLELKKKRKREPEQESNLDSFIKWKPFF